MNDRFLGRTSRRGTTRRHRSGDPRTPPRSDRVPNQCVRTHRDHSAHWSLHRTSPRENRFHSPTGHLPADRAGRLRIPHSGNGSRPIGANPTPSRTVPRHAHRTMPHHVRSTVRRPDRRIVPRHDRRTARHHAHSTTRPTVRPLVHRFAAHHAHRTAPHRSRDSRATPTAHPAASSVVPQHLPRRISHPACPDPSAIRSRERPAWPIRRRRPARSYPHLTNHSASARPSAHRRRNAHNPHRTSPRRTRSRPGTPDGASGATTASRTHPTTAPGASRAPRAQSSAAIIRFPCGCT